MPVDKAQGMTPPRARTGRRRKAALAAVMAGGLAYGLYRYQPMRYDLFPRPLPIPNPLVDPDSALLFSRGARIAVVTAHPDDAEFYAGGTLARLHDAGAQIYLVVATEGDKAFWPWENAAANRRVRTAEQRASGAMWGMREVVFLRYHDARVPDGPPVQRDIDRELARIQPNYVMTFDGDYPPRFSHKDHRSVGVAAEAALRGAHLPTVRWVLRFSTAAPNYAVDVTAEWPQKMRMLLAHRSQFHGRRLQIVSGMLPAMAASYGQMIGARYAEGFRCDRIG